MRSASAGLSAGARTERGLRVLLADERREALDHLAQVVESLGHDVMPYAIRVAEAAELIVRDEPDIACVMVHDDDDHALAIISEVVEVGSTPVIAVLLHENAEFVARAVEHGVVAYIHSASPTVVQGAFELALRGHRHTAELSAKVAQLETALDRRAMIERAKGILMERHAIDDRQAFSKLRDDARSRRIAVIDVAVAVAEEGALLPDA